MEDKRVSEEPFPGLRLEFEEVPALPEAEGEAKEHFDKFQEELNKCVYWLKGKNLEKKKIQIAFSKKVRKVVAYFYGVEFFQVGQVYIMRDGLNYVVKLHQDGEFVTLIRMHIDELKEPPEHEV